MSAPKRLDKGVICRSCIERHIDQDAYGRLMAVEDAERHTLQQIADQFAGSTE